MVEESIDRRPRFPKMGFSLFAPGRSANKPSGVRLKVCFGSMLSKKSQTALRLISRRKTNHATIVRRYAPKPVTEVTGEFIAPPHICKIAAPTARRICHQQCKMTFSTASVWGRTSVSAECRHWFGRGWSSCACAAANSTIRSPRPRGRVTSSAR